MYGDLIVSLIFIISSASIIFLILKKPYLFLKLGRHDVKLETYWLGAIFSPLIIVSFGLLNLNQVLTGLSGEHGLKPFGIIILFFSMVFISVFLDITGFFEYCALVALKFAKTNGRRLFFSLYLVVSLLTTFTSNDIVIITFTPFIYYFTKNAGISPKPYLISEFFAANTWSMTLYIGNPTNILLASTFNLKFDLYTIWMFLPTMAAGFSSLFLLYLIFKKQINKPITPPHDIKPLDAINNKNGAAFGLILLIACIIALAIAPYFLIEMWFVSLIFALILLFVLVFRDISKSLIKINSKEKKGSIIISTIKKMPWVIVPFILSLFITVEALRVYGVIGNIHSFFTSICGYSSTAYIFIYGITSALASNVLNNQPMTVAFASIIFGTPVEGLFGAILTSIIGSNLGANITPIGALAGIMWMNILTGKEFKITFREFMRYGLMITPITLIACLGVLSIEFLIWGSQTFNFLDIITSILNNIISAFN